MKSNVLREKALVVANVYLLVGMFASISTIVACGDDVAPAPTPDTFVSPDKGKPNPCASCNGCCLNGTTCMPGMNETACGLGGTACQTCGANEQCLAGVCQAKKPTCNATTCPDGCCDSVSGNCIKPPTAAACGMAGSACKVCDAQKEECKAGACQAKGPTSYGVFVVSAEVKNSDCGWQDNCDVYVEVTLGGGAPVKTGSIDNSEAPKWDFKVFDATDKELLTTKLTVVVKDDDGLLNKDDLLGECELTVTQKELDAGTLVSDCTEKVKNLTFSFKKATP